MKKNFNIAYRNWESEKLYIWPSSLQINESKTVTAAQFCWCWFNVPVRQCHTRPLGLSCLFVWLLPRGIGGLVWFGLVFLEYFAFRGFIGKLRVFKKPIELSEQLCEYSVCIKSEWINYHVFKIWQMIQVNSGFYLLNHIKAPKQVHHEFWAHNLS